MPKRKTAKGKSAASSASKDKDVTVRMFCQGLGDCFLISIPQKGNRAYQVLIDCGVAMGTDGSKDKMTDVVKQIITLTDGVVDLLAITHEHWDHVSAFAEVDAEVFKDLTVKHVWFAWTENPRDGLAKQLKDKATKAKAALNTALTSGGRGISADAKSGILGLSAFYGPDDFPAHSAFGVTAAKAGAKGSTADAMQFVKDMASGVAPAVSYLNPGQLLPLPGAAASGAAGQTNVFVLGPPHDIEFVHKLDSKTETYQKKGQSAFGSVPWTWAAGLTAGGAGSDFDQAMPFDVNQRLSLEGEAKDQEFFKARYFNPPADADSAEILGWNSRKIDEGWLDRGAQELALSINSYTNNISLVLAFELPKTKKVLLFVGDAQVGNWLSWQDLEFKRDEKSVVTMADLFKQTVLYKVGHHGSHNATLREKGLEMMTHPDLVAMLPVDEVQARKMGYGEMPLQSLQKAIKENADGRMLRLDDPWKKPSDVPGKWPSHLPPAKFKLTPGAKVPFMEYAIIDR